MAAVLGTALFGKVWVCRWSQRFAPSELMNALI